MKRPRPDDPGGATSFGVTIHTLRRLGLDLDGDGDVDEADVRRVTRAQAVDLFIEAATFVGNVAIAFGQGFFFSNLVFHTF